MDWPKSIKASKPDGFYVGYMSERGKRFRVLALFNFVLGRFEKFSDSEVESFLKGFGQRSGFHVL